WRRTLGRARICSSSMLIPPRYRPDGEILRSSRVVLTLVVRNLGELLDDVRLARFLTAQLGLRRGVVVLPCGIVRRGARELHELVRIRAHQTGVAPALCSGKGAHVDLLGSACPSIVPHQIDPCISPR